MKLIEKVLKENLTWEQALYEMNEELSYIAKTDCYNNVYLTDEEGNLLIIDSELEKIYDIPNFYSFENATYSTVKITDEALKLIRAKLYQ